MSLSGGRVLRATVIVAAAVALAGIAVPLPAVAAATDVVVSPVATHFNHVSWHGTATEPVSVTNHGSASVRIVGPASSDPHFTFGSECRDVVLGPGERCTTLVTFVDDGSAATYSATVTAAGGATATLAAIVDDPVTVTSSPVFPLTPDGETTPQQTVALVNSSDTVVELGPTASSEPSAMIFTATACLGRRLPPGASCTVRVAYHPADGAADTGSLTIPVVAGRPVVVTARGTVLPRSAPDTTQLQFGTVLRGTTGTRAVTFRNTSTEPSTFGTTTLTGAPQFRILADACGGTTVTPGGSCAVTVRARPAPAADNLFGALLVVTDGRTSRIDLFASSLSPLLFPDRALDFGAVPLGGTSAPQDLAVTNTGDAAVTLHTTLHADPGWQYDDGCDGVTLPPGDSCPIAVTFTPTRAGSTVSQPSLSVNGQGFAPRLSARGVVGAPTEPLRVSPRGLDLGAVEVGLPAPVRPVTITNTGTSAVATTSGPPPGPEVRRVDDGCTGTTLAPGASCVVRYTVAPRSSGLGGAWSFTERWNGKAYPMTLYATVVDRLQVVPGRPQFGAVELGQPTRTTIEIRNAGSRAVAVGTDPLPFDSTARHRVVRDRCAGTVLAPGATCPVILEITPRTLSDLGGRIYGLYNRQQLSVILDLHPIPWLAVDTAGIDFPRAVAGEPAAARTVTLTNVGPVTRDLHGHCAAPPGFEGDDCRDVTLAPGQSTQLAYRPLPSLANSGAGTLVVTSPPTAVRITVALTAIGVPPLQVTSGAVVVGPVPVGGVVEDDVWLVNLTSVATTAQVVVGGTAGVPDLAARDDCTGSVVEPGGRCAVHVTFRPSETQHRPVFLRMNVNGQRQYSYLTLYAR